MKKKIIIFISILIVILSILLINSCSKKEDIKVTLFDNDKVIENGSYADEYVIINIEANKVYKKIVLVDKKTNEVMEYTPKLVNGKYVLEVKVEESTNFDLYTIDEDGKKSNAQEISVKVDKKAPTFEMNENKEIYTLTSYKDKKDVIININNINDDSDYKVYYKLNNLGYKEIETSDKCEINLNLKSGFNKVSVKVVDDSGKETIKTKIIEVNYTLEIVDEKNNKMSLFKVINGEKINYYDNLPNNNDSLFKGYSINKVDLIDNDFKVNNLEKIYVIYDKSSSLSVNKPTCNNSSYTGTSINLINGNNSAYTVTNNYQTLPGTYKIIVSLNDGYIWNTADSDNKSDLILNCSISKRNITVTTDSKNKVYDGLELTGNASITSGNIGSNRFVYTSDSTITNAGSIKNEGTISIINNKDEDVTKYYNIKYNYGTLTVNKADQVCTISNVSNATYGVNSNGTFKASCTGPNTIHYGSSDEEIITVGEETYSIISSVGNAYIEVYQDGSDNYNKSITAKHKIVISTETYTVTYSYNNDYYSNVNIIDDTKEFAYGDDALSNISNPTLEGWVFKGWSTSKDSTYIVDSYTVKGDVTLYAVFKKSINLNYLLLNNSYTDTKTIDHGLVATFNLIDTPSIVDDYSFYGWTTDDSYTNIISGNKFSINEDLTLSAVYSKEVEITYNSNGGSNLEKEIGTVYKKYNGVKKYEISNLKVPTKANYNFVSWCSDSTLNTQINSISTDSNMTLYAKWVDNMTVVKFNTGTTESIVNREIKAGSKYSDLPIVENGTKGFDGWYLDNTLITTNSVIPDTASITLTAHYTNTGTPQVLQTDDTMYFVYGLDIDKDLYNINGKDIINKWIIPDIDDINNANYWCYSYDKVTAIEVTKSFINYQPTTMTYWFGMDKTDTKGQVFSTVKTINGLDNIDTSKVKKMVKTFAFTKDVEVIDISSWNTSSLENMQSTFWRAESIKTLDFSNFNTSKVSTMNYTFGGCYSLETLDLSSFDTSNVTTFSYLFGCCKSLTSLNLSSFNTSKVISVSTMFESCYNLTEIDISSFDLSKCINFRGMFKSCSKLETIYSNVDFLSYGTTLSENGGIEIFIGCTSLNNFNSNNIDIDYANPDTGYFTPNYMIRIYQTYVYNSNNKFYDVIYNATSMEFTNSVLDDSYTYVTNFDENDIGSIKLYSKDSGLYIYSNTPIYFPVDNHSSFSNLSNLESIEFNNLVKTNHCTNLSQLFYHSGKIKTLDLSCFDTSNASISYMFEGCTSLESVDLSSFVTTNCTSLNYFFCDCRKLKSVDLSNFDTRNVKGFSYMFFQCFELMSLDLSNFDTSKVTNMKYMFYGCHALSSLDLTSFDVSNVTDMRSMFTECTSLVTLDLSSFDTSKVENVFRLFSLDSKLTTIYVSKKWDISGVTGIDTDGYGKDAEVFVGCSKLVGGNGTVYSSSHTNKDYAIIDGINPGYLTLKVNKILNFSKSITSETTSIFDGIENIIFQNGITYTDDYYDLSVNQDRSIKMYLIDKNCYITSNGVIEFPSDSSKFFNELRNIKSIDFGEGVIDTSKVTNMVQMFYYCKALTSLDLSEFNTSNVSNMNNMFAYMTNITDYDLSSFDTRKVTNMNKMFYDNAALVNLDINNFVTPKLTDMENMFAWSIELKNVNMDNINTSNVTNMRWLFSCCYKIEVIDISNLDTSKVENMFGMFSACKEVKTIYVSDLFKTDKVTNGEGMFSDCPKLVGRNGTTYNADHIDYDYARIDDSGSPGYFSVKTIKNLYTSYIENSSSLKDTLVNATSLTFTDSILDSSYTFKANVDSSDNGLIKLYSKGTDLYIYSNSKVYLPVNSSQVFRDLNSVKTIKFNNLLSSSYSTSFYWLFCRNFELTSIDMESLDTSLVTNMYGMFEQCKSLRTLDLRCFDTSKVENFSFMFSKCLELESVYLIDVNFSKATNFRKMFGECEKLKNIYCNADLKKVVNLNNLTDASMALMFENCYLLPGFSIENDTLDYANPDTGYFTPNYMKNFYNLDSQFRQSIKSITFTNQVFDNSYTFISNLDSLNLGTIKMYSKNDDVYITSPYTIYFPEDSSSMFNNCINVETYNFDNISTIHATDFSYFFSKNRKLSSIDLSNFDTRNVIYMDFMFDAVDVLTSIDISNFDTSKVISFRHMFAYASALSNLNLGKLNTSSATNMEWMFYHAHELITLDISSFDVSNVTNFKGMFEGCKNLTDIYYDGDWSSRSSSLVTDGDLNMFYNCLALSNYSESNVNINYANSNTGYFTGRIMKNLYTSYTSDTNSALYDVLVNATSLEFTNSVLDDSYTFKANIDSNNVGSIKLYSKGNKLYIYSKSKVYFPENSTHLFEGLSSVKSINFNNLVDTSRVTTMYSMFYNCSSLEDLDLRCFDTCNVTNMNELFRNCILLKSINLSSFNTSNVKSMTFMFQHCEALISLDLSNFDTSNVTSMANMFDACHSLVSLNINSFDTKKVTTMRGMFYDCNKIEMLDLSSFDTSSLNNIYRFFGKAIKLTTIYVSNKFNVKDIVDNTDAGYLNTGEIFTDCIELVGANGTAYDSSYVDKDYAVVDMAYYDENGSIVSGNPGYFTLKNIIPKEYEKVSYIETDKNQYITTDITIEDIKDKYTMDVEFEALSLYNYNTLWGSTLNEDTFEGWIYGVGGIRSRSNDLYIDNRETSIPISLNAKHRYSTFVESNTTSFSLFDNNKSNSDVNDGRGISTASYSSKILLLKSGNDYSHLKLYSFKIISNDVIIADFVPVKRKSDGKYGLYDTIRNKFYKSEGSSDFIGPNE